MAKKNDRIPIVPGMKEYKNRYWEREDALVAETGRNTIKYYMRAGKLQVSTPEWYEPNGDIVSGKIVTIDLAALKRSESGMKVMKYVMEDICADMILYADDEKGTFYLLNEPKMA